MRGLECLQPSLGGFQLGLGGLQPSLAGKPGSQAWQPSLEGGPTAKPRGASSQASGD